MPFRSRLWPPLLSAGLMLLAYWPLNWFLIAFVAPAPLLWELSRRTGWRAWRAGVSYGFIFMAGQFWWLLHLVQRWVGSAPLGLLPLFLGSLISAVLWFGPMGWLLSKCWSLNRPWLIPFVWAGAEIVRTLCPTLAYPWGISGSVFADAAPLIQLAWFGSVYAVSAWAVIPSVIAALLLQRVGVEKVTRYGYAFSLLAVISIGRYLVPIKGDPITVVAGQPGVDWAFDQTMEAYNRDLKIHQEHIANLVADAANRQAKLLVLPEGANSNSRFPVEPDFYLDPNLPTMFGSHRAANAEETYQSAYLAEGGKYQWADKTRLVIFGEYVPGRQIIPFLDAFNLPTKDVQAAKSLSNIRSHDLRIAPIVCFEGLFPDLVYTHARMGADIVAIMSIDDWFEGTAAMEQLRSGSIFRAIESGLPVVRSAQTGYSMVIDPRGNVLNQAPLGEMASIPATVRIGQGGIFPLLPLFSVLSLLSLLWVAVGKPGAQEDEEVPESTD